MFNKLHTSTHSLFSSQSCDRFPGGVNPHLYAMERPFGRGPTTLLRNLLLIVINHLQVLG